MKQHDGCSRSHEYKFLRQLNDFPMYIHKQAPKMDLVPFEHLGPWNPWILDPFFLFLIPHPEHPYGIASLLQNIEAVRRIKNQIDGKE